MKNIPHQIYCDYLEDRGVDCRLFRLLEPEGIHLSNFKGIHLSNFKGIHLSNFNIQAGYKINDIIYSCGWYGCTSGDGYGYGYEGGGFPDGNGHGHVGDQTFFVVKSAQEEAFEIVNYTGDGISYFEDNYNGN